eukprot:6282027-Pyramimonas_sp.AAC.1
MRTVEVSLELGNGVVQRGVLLAGLKHDEVASRQVHGQADDVRHALVRGVSEDAPCAFRST